MSERPSSGINQHSLIGEAGEWALAHDGTGSTTALLSSKDKDKDKDHHQHSIATTLSYPARSFSPTRSSTTSISSSVASSATENPAEPAKRTRMIHIVSTFIAIFEVFILATAATALAVDPYVVYIFAGCFSCYLVGIAYLCVWSIAIHIQMEQRGFQTTAVRALTLILIYCIWRVGNQIMDAMNFPAKYGYQPPWFQFLRIFFYNINYCFLFTAFSLILTLWAQMTEEPVAKFRRRGRFCNTHCVVAALVNFVDYFVECAVVPFLFMWFSSIQNKLDVVDRVLLGYNLYFLISCSCYILGYTVYGLKLTSLTGKKPAVYKRVTKLVKWSCFSFSLMLLGVVVMIVVLHFQNAADNYDHFLYHLTWTIRQIRLGEMLVVAVIVFGLWPDANHPKKEAYTWW